MIAINETDLKQPKSVAERQHLTSGPVRVFNHQLFEYKKGLRDLVLHTCPRDIGYWIIRKLERLNIPYLIYPLGTKRINVFFGNKSCLEIVRHIGKFNLSAYTPEEDFILGIMLGYDRRQQCERYLKLKYDCSVAILTDNY